MTIPPLQQQWPQPSKPRPIVLIGCGGIANDAHLPTYRKLGFPVAGVFDRRPEAAAKTAHFHGLRKVFGSLEEALSQEGVVFDLAVTGTELPGLVEKLPSGAAVLMQKPMGENLAEARRILESCRKKALSAALNFQLRFAPNMLAIRDALRLGLFGEILDLEVRICLHTPWDRWEYLEGKPRLEMLYHSVHYVDLIRSFLGEAKGVYAKAVKHPASPKMADTRSSIILDYGDHIRCSLALDHAHGYGAKHAVSHLKIEGTKGAAVAKMGVNLNYPKGEPDDLELCLDGSWKTVPLRGSWFFEAFEGPMSNLQRFAAGEDKALLTSVEDSVKTMATVEAAYLSSAGGGIPIP